MREEERQSEEVPSKFLSLSPPPLLFLALSPSLSFPFLLSLSFSSSSSEIVLSDISTTGKWQGYKDTHTHTYTLSQTQGEGLKARQRIIRGGIQF